MFRRSPRKIKHSNKPGESSSSRSWRRRLRSLASFGGIVLGLPMLFLLSNVVFDDSLSAGLAVFEIQTQSREETDSNSAATSGGIPQEEHGNSQPKPADPVVDASETTSSVAKDASPVGKDAVLDNSVTDDVVAEDKVATGAVAKDEIAAKDAVGDEKDAVVNDKIVKDTAVDEKYEKDDIEDDKVVEGAVAQDKVSTKDAVSDEKDTVMDDSVVKGAVVDGTDKDCPFRDSPIVGKVYVYPNYGDVDNGWSDPMLSEAGRNLTALPRWPWLDMDAHARHNATGHYNINSQNVQYTTELLVREVITNPKSCLRTTNPDEATLFYVPYLPSIEHHMGHNHKTDYSLSPYGQAIRDILEKNDYTGWENHFGLTSKYWKRRDGSDHILVFSEPMHGLWHPRSRRGNFHFIHSQYQLTPPIVISVELSTSFVAMYPKCAAKNILMPYPNSDGAWFNDKYQQQALELIHKANLTASQSTVALPAERELASSAARPVAQFYSAGKHGTCRQLRGAMTQDYKFCAPSFPALKTKLQATPYVLGMRLSTFCPCPGGDSPSAKRHFDAILAGCIPIILSHDFVWPFTNEFDPLIGWDPNDFSLRLNASDYDEPLLNSTTCLPKNATRPGLQAYLESIPLSEIQRLRHGMDKAKYMYSWYREDETLVENPLREGVLPDGGTAHTLVQMLAERAAGARWPACQEELKLDRGPDPKQFLC